MASQSQGIQQLQQAEKWASEKVSEAHKQKSRRPKQAKEAQAEIEQYLPAEGERVQGQEAAALGFRGSCSSEVEKETEEMSILIRQNREEVLDNLLAFVCDIRPEIHENYHING